MNSDIAADTIYLAGQQAPAGTYRQVEGSREVRLDCEDILPATCDGHVAAYVRRPETWGQRKKQDNA